MAHQFLFWFLFILIIAVICIAWLSGIEKMRDDHPDYKGEDLFNEKK